MVCYRAVLIAKVQSSGGVVGKVASILLSILASYAVSACVTTQGRSVPGLKVLEPFAYDVVATFKSSRGTGYIRKLKLESGYDIQISQDYYGIPLAGVTRIDGALDAGGRGEAAVIINGEAEGCPTAYQVYVLNGESMRTHRLGNCRDRVIFTRSDDGGFMARQGEGDGAQVWVYQPQQGLRGPVSQASLTPKAPPRPPIAAAPPKASVPAWKKPGKEAPPKANAAPPADRTEPRAGSQRVDVDQGGLPPVLENKGDQIDVTVWKIRTDAQR